MTSIEIPHGETVNITIHECNDEQLAVLWSNSLISEIRPIVRRRDGGEDFAIIVVVLPGVKVTYYWQSNECTFSADVLLHTMAECLYRQGEGDFEALYFEACRRAGVTPSINEDIRDHIETEPGNEELEKIESKFGEDAD